MLRPTLRWAYRRAARWRSSILLVTLVTFGVVSVHQRALQRGQYLEQAAALHREENQPSDCVSCSAWDDAESVEELAGLEVFSRLAAEFSEGSLSTHCGRLLFPDGQPLCLDTDLLPQAGHCLVYSVSLNSSLAFEADLARRLGCDVHTFDPTAAPLAPSSLPANVSRHLMGAAGRTEHHRAEDGRRIALMTLDELTAVLGHQERNVHYLRLDAEGGEWDALQQQLESGTAMLHRVRQLNVKFHLALPRGPFGGDRQRRSQLSEKDARRFLRTLVALKAAGFRLAHTRSTGEFENVDIAQEYGTLWIRWAEVECSVNKTRGGVRCCEYSGKRCDA